MKGNDIITGTGVFQGNPFPGSRPFLPSEDRFFFGRSQAVNEVLDKLLKNRFLTLLGSSASGKTSLVLSGLIPALLSDDSQEWVPVVIQPGEAPLQSLVKGFQQVFPNRFSEEDAANLVSGSVKLGDMLAEKGLNSYQYLLVVDQFEDLFTIPSIKRNRKKAGRSPESRQFVSRLIEAVETESVSIYVLISLRSAFLTQSSAYRELTEYINKSKYLLPRMSREALLEIITEPIHQAGASVVRGFEQVLLDDLDDEAPLLHLQYALRRTWMKWKARHQPTQPVSTEDYYKGAAGHFSIPEQMEAAYQSLDMVGKLICEKLFKALAFKDDNREAFSRPVSVGSVARIARCNMEEVHAVVRAFRRPGGLFLTLSSKKVIAETRVSLAHDHLVEVWDRLDAWVEEEAISIKTYLQLSEYSLRYQQGKCSLLSGDELLEAMEWRVRHNPDPAWGIQFDPAFERAMVYLSTSEEEHMSSIKRKRSRERRRKLVNRVVWISISLVAAVAVVLVLLMRYGNPGVNEAESSAAREVQDIGNEQPAVIQSQPGPQAVDEAMSDQPEIDVSPAEEGTGTLIGAQEEPAEEDGPDSRRGRFARNRQADAVATAEQEQSPAERTSELINEEPSATLPEEAAAESSENIIQTEPLAKEAVPALSTMDIIRDVAQQSRELSGDPELQALLAYQSYLLHKENGGASHDQDIYFALYEGLKKLIDPAYRFYPGIPNSVKAMEWIDRTGSILITESGGGMRILSGNVSESRNQIELAGTGMNNECLGLSPDETVAAVGTNGGGLLFVELESKGKVVDRSGDHGKLVLFIQNLGNSGSFLTAGGDMRILQWGYNSRRSSVLLEAEDRISSMVTSRDGSNVVFGLRNGKLYRASVANPAEMEEIGDFGRNRVTSLIIDPTGRTLVAGLLDGTLRVMNMDGRRRARLTGPASRISDLDFSPDGRFMAAASNDGNVYLWSSSDWGQAPLTFSENNGYVLALCFSRNSQYFFSGSREFPKMVGRPTNTSQMAGKFCQLLGRNLTREEWAQYFGDGIPYRETCPDTAR